MGTVDSILALVKNRLKIFNTDEDLGLMDVINETIRTYNVFETYIKKRKKLERDTKGWYCLPIDFYHLLVVEGWVQNSNNIITNQNNVPTYSRVPFIYYDGTYLNNAGFNGTFEGRERVSCSINGNKLYISADLNTIESVYLTYEGYNTDEFGKFNAPVDFEFAVAYRIMTEYAHEHRKNYAADTIQYWEKRADKLEREVTVKSNVRSFRRNYLEIVDVANAILIDKPGHENNGGWNG